MNNPAAINPLILFSINSAMSNGFFSALGAAVPSTSFAPINPTTINAGSQNSGFAYHGSGPRSCSGSFCQ